MAGTPEGGKKAAKVAKEKGFDAFTTTLLVSPYQNHELIIKVAEEKTKKYGVDFTIYKSGKTSCNSFSYLEILSGFE